METSALEFRHLEEVLDRYGETLVTKYQTYAPEATGHLAQNTSFEVKCSNGTYQVILDLPHYWKYVENGRKAGKQPPVERILEWVRAKPVIPRAYNGKLPTEKQLAFLIARSIGEHGTEGRHCLERAQEETDQILIESVKQAFLEDIGEDLDKVLMLLY